MQHSDSDRTKPEAGQRGSRDIRCGGDRILFLALFITLVFGQPVAHADAPVSDEICQLVNEDKLDLALEKFGTLVDSLGNDSLGNDGGKADGDEFAECGIAAAAIHRALAPLSDSRRFDLWSQWSLPSSPDERVRLATLPARVVAPPRSMARAMGQRPSDDSFVVPQTGAMIGLFSSADQWLSAAQSMGRLASVRHDLMPWVENSDPNAAWLVAMIDWKSQNANLELSKNLLAKNDNNLLTSLPLIGWMAAEPTTAAVAIAAIDANVDRARADASPMLPMLACWSAEIKQSALGTSPPESLQSPGDADWLPAHGDDADANLAPPIWVAYEGHWLPVCGPPRNRLVYRYPLTGSFEFHCETQHGGQTGVGGQIQYGSVQFQCDSAAKQLTVVTPAQSTGEPVTETVACPFYRVGDGKGGATFNRLSLVSDGQVVRFEVNGHPMFRMPIERTSPWLSLVDASGGRQPLFRNLSFQSDAPPVENVALSMADFETQSRRPLFDGETWSYRFKTDGPKATLHPVFGRMAFLLTDRGVRMRWLTDRDNDWTGLASDHALLEPFNRRPGGDYQLIPDDWNLVALSRTGDTIRVRLNDNVVYEREMETTSDASIGFLQEDPSQAAPVKDIRVSGWPVQPPPLAMHEHPSSPSTIQLIPEHVLDSNIRQIRRRIEQQDPQQAFKTLCRWVLPNPVRENYRTSSFFRPLEWPAAMEDGGALAPCPFPGLDADDSDRNTVISPVYDLVSTAVQTDQLRELKDRIDAAADDSPTQKRSSTALTTLCSIAEMDSIAEQDWDRVYKNVETLRQQFADDPASGDSVPWPETLVANVLLSIPATKESAETLVLDLLYSPKGNQLSKTNPTWFYNLISLAPTISLRQQTQVQSDLFTPIQHPDWLATHTHTSRWHGEGRLPGTWYRNPQGMIVHIGGHPDHRLIHRDPVTGPTDVDVDVWSWGAGSLQRLGFGIGAGNGSNHYDRRRWNQDATPIAIAPPLEKPNQWLHLRTSIGSETVDDYLSGHKLSNASSSSESDSPKSSYPFVGIQTHWQPVRQFKNLTIAAHDRDTEPLTGHGSQPLRSTQIDDRNDDNRIIITPDANWSGWSSYYHRSIGRPNDAWRYEPLSDDASESTDQSPQYLIGSEWGGPQRWLLERCLQYDRPLRAGESISYRFQTISAGGIRRMVHPALGRLAFLLQPDGVRLHWMTDSNDDLTNLSPGNASVDPDDEIQLSALAFREDDWNELTIARTDDDVEIRLNEVCIYRSPLPATVMPHFGLFHYSDQSRAVVDQIAFYPKTSATDSSGADLQPASIAELETFRNDLEYQFDFDFKNQTEAEINRYFSQLGGNQRTTMQLTPAGLAVQANSFGNWEQWRLRPRFGIHGDFDVTAEIEGLTTTGNDKEFGARIDVNLDDPQLTQLGTALGFHMGRNALARGLKTTSNPDGSKAYNSTTEIDYSTSARLRLIRRGGMFSSYIAQGDSPNFRLLHHATAPQVDVDLGGISLLTLAGARGDTRVIWKSLSIAAEHLTFEPGDADDRKALAIWNPKTGTVRELCRSMEGYQMAGSPDWSHDQKHIAFDQHNGSTIGAHVAIVSVDNLDDGDLNDGDGQASVIDVGVGSMPVYSPDDKQFVVSVAGQGIVVKNADGSDARVIDPSGWGGQWSPNGRWIAYTKSNQIFLYELSTATSRPLFDAEQQSGLGYLYWNLAWSPDSRHIVTKADTKNTPDDAVILLVTLGANEVKLTPLMSAKRLINLDFSWSPMRLGHITVALDGGNGRSAVLYDLPIDPSLPLQPHPQQPMALNCSMEFGRPMENRWQSWADPLPLLGHSSRVVVQTAVSDGGSC